MKRRRETEKGYECGNATEENNNAVIDQDKDGARYTGGAHGGRGSAGDSRNGHVSNQGSNPTCSNSSNGSSTSIKEDNSNNTASTQSHPPTPSLLKSNITGELVRASSLLDSQDDFAAAAAAAATAAGGGGGGSDSKRPKSSKFEIQYDVDWREKSEAIANGALRLKTPTSRYSYAMVCSSNVNRSVKAQIVLNSKAISSESYGVGSQVKLPGKDKYTPKVFPFGTPYTEIYDSLEEEDANYFERNGVLRLMARNACVKRAPERWQDVPGSDVAQFDVVFCFENRIFDVVVEDMQQREPEDFKAIHLIAMSVNDSPEEAEKASYEVLDLCQTLELTNDLELDAANIIEEFQARTKRPILHQVVHL